MRIGKVSEVWVKSQELRIEAINGRMCPSIVVDGINYAILNDKTFVNWPTHADYVILTYFKDFI